MNFSYLRRATRTLLFAAIFGAALGSTMADAQTSQGTLIGVARDKTGAVMPNVQITLKNEATGETRSLQTRADGAYRAEALPPGKYTVDAMIPGFTKFEAKDLNVASSQVTTYDVVLEIGTANAEVTVQADQATIDTDNGTLSGVVSSEELSKVPIFTLNPVELAITVPGVQPVSAGGYSNGINIQVNGARPRDNNFLMDGQEINDVGIGGQAFQPQIPDIFDSVNVITSGASAEYGRAGGAVVNLVTKQGTNQFHGEGFERYTGSGLNSVPGGFRGSPYQKARYDQHSYGFSAGGPIIKNKLFGFGGLILQRFYGQEQAGVNLLPDAAGYATLQTVTGAPAAQVALLDQYLSNGAYLKADYSFGSASGTPITQNVGALPGCPATGCVISFAGFERPNQAEVNPDTQWMYRVDFTPWEKDHISFRYLHDRTSLTPDFGNNGLALAGFDTLQGGPTELGEGQWVHIFTQNLENEFRVSEARIAFTFSPTAQTLANPLNFLPTISLTGLKGTTTAGSVTFPSLGPNQNFPQGRKEDLYQFQDTVGWTKGHQSFRIGADIGRLIEIDLVSQNALGTLGFVKGGSGNNALGNFLLNQLGPSGTATVTYGNTRADSHGYRNGIFAQDDWKATPDLTVNLGVRYDYLTNPENSIAYPGEDPANIFAPINTVVRVKNDYNNIAPRLGFAYSPHAGGFLGDGKTVIRGGFGIFYDSTFSNILVNATQTSPNAAAGTLIQTSDNGLANAISLIPTIPKVLNPKSTVENEASNTVNPITYQYNLGVERELPGQNVLSVRYIGVRGEKEFANQQYNYFDGATHKRLNPDRGAIILRGNYADSDYNAVEVTGTHNFAHGFLIKANYTYGKDLDDGSEIRIIGASSPTSFSANLAPGGRGQDWGPSAYDHRQFFSAIYVWSPKGFHSAQPILNAGLGLFTRHWTISGVSQLQSGGYSTFNTNGLDLNGDGSSSNDRPIIGNQSAPLSTVGIDGRFVGGTSGVYYDLGQNNTDNSLVPITANQVHFLVPYFPLNQFLHQEIGRNSYQLPGNTTHNLAIEKGIGLSYLHFPQGQLTLRGEASNVFNHNDNNVSDTNVLDAAAGFLTPSRTNPNLVSNRNLILWGKLQF
jgi:outer membrane receptor protein involved in Fe transport